MRAYVPPVSTTLPLNVIERHRRTLRVVPNKGFLPEDEVFEPVSVRLLTDAGGTRLHFGDRVAFTDNGKVRSGTISRFVMDWAGALKIWVSADDTGYINERSAHEIVALP